MMKRRRQRGCFLLTHGHGVDRRLSYCDMGNIAKVDCLTEVVDRTNLPCVQDIIAKRDEIHCSAMCMVSLDYHMPAHRALSQVAAARTGPRFGPGWRRRPGGPRHSWIQQIGDGTCTLQYSCRMVQGWSSWPLWVDATDRCCLHDLMMMMMMPLVKTKYNLIQWAILYYDDDGQ